MCGRFQLSVSGKQITERFDVEVFDELYRPSFNCAPSQYLPVITNEHPKEFSFFRWGLIPFWAKDTKIGFRLINARSETVNKRPSYKQAFFHRRCLIPANGFYEWKKGKKKKPYRFLLKNESLFAMAGLWERWKNPEGKIIKSFTIITTEANTLVKNVHDRMPVILSQKNERIWIGEDHSAILKGLLKPYNADEMEFYAISEKINSPLNNNADLINPIAEQEKMF